MEVEAERKDKKSAAPTSETAPPANGVHVSGGAVNAQRDVVGGSVTKRDEYNFANSNVTINQSAAPTPAPTPQPFVPQRASAVYVPRGIEKQVCERLLSGNGVAAIVSVYAPGGVGKTELAIQVENELRAQFEKTFWVDCNAKPPEAVLDDTARAVGCALTPQADYAGRLQELAAFLSQRRYLLVFDDVRAENAALFQQFMPPAPCAALLTSRLTEISHRIAPNATFPLKTMDETQARALMEATLTPTRVNDEADAAARLLKRCRFHPLALDIAARLILKLANDGVKQPIAAIEKRVAQNLDALAAGSDERSNLFAVFAVSYDALDETDQTRFQKLAAFAPSGFGIPAVAFVWETDERDAETTLERFYNLSLLKHTEESAARFRFHDLLDEYAQTLLARAGQEKHARRAHAQFLVNLFDEHYVLRAHLNIPTW